MARGYEEYSMPMRLCLITIAAAASLCACGTPAPEPAPQAAVPAGPRIYVFDTGSISGLDPQLFNFTREELAEVDFVNMAYLIVHPEGTLMFDTGGIPDARFGGDGQPVTEGVMSASMPLRPRLEAMGHAPETIDYLAMSHYHSDHTGNANMFAGATWIVQQAERDVMFADDPQGIIAPGTYGALREARTHLLQDEDFDVFGDGTVVLLSAPGHTPGHQVLVVRLANRGPVLLAGDLYHYPEERSTGRVPTFEFDPERSRATRERIEAFLAAEGAELWIEHDKATHAALPKAPAFID
jgi:glyoxylase-like metal-dependent hydrolase (beta-lactamase superfamily II)